MSGFFCKMLPFGCSVEEIGRLYWDKDTPKDLAESLIQKYLQSRSKGSNLTTGATLIHFAKWQDRSEYNNKEWMELFKEAGFKQVLPEYENHVHPGTMITQLVYIHEKKSETRV